jgi:NAD-dependent deacetylase
MDIDRLQQMVSESDNIVFFGGAGVSTESGIPDFRGSTGLYRENRAIPAEGILSHTFFMTNPDEFYDFYRAKLVVPNALPNKAHRALAKLERIGKLSAVVTQNIDGLHQDAGSRVVLELHGSIRRNYCMACGKPYGLDTVLKASGVPRCMCGGIIKPDVVLYEEPLDQAVLRKAADAIAHADLLIVGGTSLSVYPASGLLDYFHGNHLVLINKTATPRDGCADLIFREGIGQILTGLFPFEGPGKEKD